MHFNVSFQELKCCRTAVCLIGGVSLRDVCIEHFYIRVLRFSHADADLTFAKAFVYPSPIDFARSAVEGNAESA